MIIGFSIVSTSLSIKEPVDNYEDFTVYFSNVLVNGEKKIESMPSGSMLAFTPDLSEGTFVLDYEVTNGSETYYAGVTVNCVTDNKELILVNTFDSTNAFDVLETRRGKIEVTGDASLKANITCEIDAIPVEKKDSSKKEEEFNLAQAFCENRSYKYGLINDESYDGAFTKMGDISNVAYFCSNESDFSKIVYGFDSEGTLLFEWNSEINNK